MQPERHTVIVNHFSYSLRFSDVTLFFLTLCCFLKSLFFNSSAAFADAAHHEEEHEEGNVYFRFFKRKGKVALRRRRTGGKKQDLGQNGFQLELHHLKQKDGRGRDTGEMINTFTDHTFSLSSFNRRAKVDGELQDFVYNSR